MNEINVADRKTKYKELNSIRKALGETEIISRKNGKQIF